MQLRVQISIDKGSQTTVVAETVTVSRHGAKIRVTAPNGASFTTGDEVRITLSNGRDPQTAKVVWSRSSDAQYGIELESPVPLWGVVFPSPDGEWKYERKPVKTPTKPEVAPVLVHPATPTTPIPAKSKAEAPVLSAGNGIVVSITGFSAVRSPFSEVSELTPISPHEASILLKHLVDVGATLRIAGREESAGSKARVINVSRNREGGKWRVRIKSEDPLDDHAGLTSE